MKKKLVIFDLDGTILDTALDLTNAVNFALQKHDKDILSVDEVVHATGRGMKLLLSDAIGKVDQETFDQAYFEFAEYYSVFCCLFTKPYKDVKETLEDLKNKGYKLAVISNKNDNTVNLMINYYYPNTFDFVSGFKEGGKHKPDPEMVNKCLETLKIAKEDAFFVGDSAIDYKTAVNSNVDHMNVTYGFRTKEELIEAGVNNLEDSIKDIYKYI